MTLLRVKPMRGCDCEQNYYSRPEDREMKWQESSDVSWAPVTDIYDTDENYVLKMEIPGYSKDDVNVEFKDNILSVSGEKKEELVEDARIFRSERRTGKFARSFKLPRDVDGTKIDAKLKDGVLELKVAKPEEKKPRHIPINFN